MREHRKNSRFDRYFTIWLSVLQRIARESASWPDLETGGELYGWRTQAGRCIVLFATGPGKNAVHRRIHFRQDDKYFRETARWLWETYGIQLVGRWHSHHRLALDRPSQGDRRSALSLCRRNNLARFVEIITTHEDAESGHMSRRETFSWLGSHEVCLASTASAFAVRINAFDHRKPQESRFTRCPIKVMPGLSPIEYAAVSRDLAVDGRSDWCDFAFPVERIRFEPYADRSQEPAESDAAASLPEVLQEQMTQLPEGVCQGAVAHVCKEFFILDLPVQNARLMVALDAEPPHAACRVCISQEDKETVADVTLETLVDGCQATLGAIWHSASTLLSRTDPEVPTDALGGPSTFEQHSGDPPGRNGPISLLRQWFVE